MEPRTGLLLGVPACLLWAAYCWSLETPITIACGVFAVFLAGVNLGGWYQSRD